MFATASETDRQIRTGFHLVKRVMQEGGQQDELLFFKQDNEYQYQEEFAAKYGSPLGEQRYVLSDFLSADGWLFTFWR